MMVTFVDGQVCCNFHGMLQCYGLMLHIAIILKRVHMIGDMSIDIVTRQKC